MTVLYTLETKKGLTINMERRYLGKTGLLVSRLGVGLAEIGHFSPASDVSLISQLVNTAIEHGLNFFDTASCYGHSEELLGKALLHNREKVIIATKAGHALDSMTRSWTYETIRKSIERSLKRLNTEYIDIVQLHSCDVDVLKQGEVIRALQEAKQQGKTRFIGYSGDNESAGWAVESDIFDTLQTSFNIVDQKARSQLLPKAAEHEMGIIVKRPIANAAWAAAQNPSAYAGEYFRRSKKMIGDNSLPTNSTHPLVISLGFVFAHNAIDVAIVGTKNPVHMQNNINWVENDLPIDKTIVQRWEQKFDEVGSDWSQQN